MPSLDNSKIILTLSTDSTGEPLAAGDASEATLSAVLTELQTPALELPPRPLKDTTDLTVTRAQRSTSGETTLVSATASQTTRVHEILITTTAATTVELRDGAGGTVLRRVEFPDKGGVHREFREDPYAVTTANTALIFATDNTAVVDIEIDYVKSA